MEDYFIEQTKNDPMYIPLLLLLLLLLLLYGAGSSRMKGGSMTVLLLNVVFSLAFSRAFSIPLSELLCIPESFLPSHTPSLGSNGSSVMGNGTRSEETCCHSLSEGESEVALLVDAFQATYNSAYRSVSNDRFQIQFSLVHFSLYFSLFQPHYSLPYPRGSLSEVLLCFSGLCQVLLRW